MLEAITRITRVMLVLCMCIVLACGMSSAATKRAPTKTKPAKPAAKPAGEVARPFEKEDIGRFDVPGASVVYKDIRPSYAKALVTVAGEARRLFAKYGFDVPSEVTIAMRKDKEGQTALWTDGESTMTLVVRSGVDLYPPLLSGVYNIYGMCHEIGHMAMYRKVEHIGLPDGVPEAWAHYAGSVMVDEVFAKCGEKLYPVPYDYKETEGTARLKEQASQEAKTGFDKAAQAFYRAHERFGATKVMGAMKTALDARPAGKDLMSRFVSELVKSTDESARELFPDDVVTPKLTWNVVSREITDKTFEGLKADEQGGGVTLSYDDGKSDDFLSDCGSGFAVVYKCPAGSWAVDQVNLYGSRFGSEDPPKEDFRIYICDKDFSVVKEIRKPYATFERGDARWYSIDIEPVKVPEVFYVCFYFNATTYKGVYVHRDKGGPASHSKYALPYTFIADTDGGFDWMIRAHLVKDRD